MILAGLNVCRINFSHCNHEDAIKILNIISELNIELNSHVAIMGDLQGPKLRIGLVEEKSILKKGDNIVIQHGYKKSNNKELFVDYKTICNDIRYGEKILLDDGKIVLRAMHKVNNQINCFVVQGGELKEKKGLNLPNTKISIPTITEKDKIDLDFCIKNKIEWIALSFCKKQRNLLSN